MIKKLLIFSLVFLMLFSPFVLSYDEGETGGSGHDGSSGGGSGGGGYCPPGGGCGGDNGSEPYPDPPPECCSGGQSCSCSGFGCCAGLVCCDGTCKSSCVECGDGICDTTEDCLQCSEDCGCCEEGRMCLGSSDCCSGYCCFGKCSPGPCGGECMETGESCSSPDDCCSGYCCDGKCSETTCCKLNGKTCGSNNECCSGFCCDGTCQDSCQDQCSSSGGSCSSQSCCEGLQCCANNVCRESCCTPKDGQCPSEYPCCPGYICCQGKCTKGVSASCSTDDDCCTGYCCDGTCSADPCCQKTGETCSNGDCCSDLECCNGVCKDSCCRSNGESCLSNQECCSNNCCNGFCQETCGGSCEDGETSSCGQYGVCAEEVQTCQEGEWPGCNFLSIPGYEESEITCNDGLDNDCDGLIDCVDPDPDCAVSHSSLGCFGGYGDLDVYWFDSCGRAQDRKEDCADGKPCTKDSCVEGKCKHEKITSCEDNDFCCPPGCLVSEDSDCKSCSSKEDCVDFNDCTEDSCDQGTCRSVWFECGEEDGCCAPDCDYTNDPDCLKPVENKPSTILIHSPSVNDEFKTEKLGELVDLKFAVLDSEDEYMKCFYKVDGENKWREITEVTIHNNTNLTVSVLVISTQPSEKEKHQITMKCSDGSIETPEPVTTEFYLKRPIGTQAPPKKENETQQPSVEKKVEEPEQFVSEEIAVLVVVVLTLLLVVLVVSAFKIKRRKG